MLGGRVTQPMETGTNIRTLQQITREANEIISRAADRQVGDLPSPIEVRHACEILRLTEVIHAFHNFVATGFVDQWEDYLRQRGLL